MAIELPPPGRRGIDEFVARYDMLRRKLLVYFGQRPPCPREELADETLYQVLIKVMAGGVANIDAYTFGVAPKVHVNWLRTMGSEAPLSSVVDPPLPSSAKAVCLERCLRKLKADRRELLEAYFVDRDRVALAKRLGIGRRALSWRVCRIKRSVSACVAACLEKAGADTK